MMPSLSSSRRSAALWGGTALLVAGASCLAQDFSDVQIVAHPVAGKVSMLEGAGGNIGVSVGPDGLLIVDDQFAPLADKIRAALRELGKGDLAFVLNTHWHGDHTGGNAAFGPEATIIAHRNVRERLGRGDPERSRPAAPPEALPVITFDESLSIHFNGEEIRVLHVPSGHTDGDSVIHFTGSNVVHMGDQFFSGLFPFVDVASGGTLEGYTRNVATLLDELPADVKIIPGHGPLSDLDDLRAFHRMLVETTEIVRKAIAAGRSLDEIRREGLPDRYASWSWRFIDTERWLGTIHGELSR